MLRKNYVYAGPALRKNWSALHKGDCEPYPSEAEIGRAAKEHPAIQHWIKSRGGASEVAERLQDAWREFHAGDFVAASKIGSEEGMLGCAVANKAVAIHTLYLEKSESRSLELLRKAIERGERASKEWPDSANVHYTLALVLGRYSQRISIIEALAAGYGSRIANSLQRALSLEPKHAEAHIAMGLYHAEIVSKLGGLAARLTYGASQEAAIEHFDKAIKLAPKSAIAHVEYARGLLLMSSTGHQGQVEKLCSHAAALKPLDKMEQLDVERAQQHCTSL